MTRSRPAGAEAHGPPVRAGARDSVVVYWRPGCGYCSRLRDTLGAHADQAQWINIWEDPSAAAFVRSVNDGNEVVPTVVLDGIPVTNPHPRVVLERLTR